MPAPIRLTVLSDMAGTDLQSQVNQAADWGLTTLDLKTVLGKNIADLTEAEATQAAQALASRDVRAQAFSTALFKLHVEEGEAAFAAHLEQLEHVLKLAAIIRPHSIRLIAPETRRRKEISDTSSMLRDEYRWVIPQYIDAVGRIHAAGFQTVIENETGGSMFSAPGEIVNFFNALGHRDKVSYTWDVQNLWQLGTFPTLDVYRQLKPFIGYLHLKGGIAGEDGRTLKWRSTLEAASWPVLEITRAVIADGVSPVICTNPSHGAAHPAHPMDGAYQRDLEFLRRELSPSIQ